MAVGDVQPEVKKSATAFRTISEVGRELDVPQHVLRFWESKFSQVKPLKRGGGRRYYRPEDIALLRRIRDLLYTEGYTIRGVQRLFREVGLKVVLEGGNGIPEPETVPVPARDTSGGKVGGSPDMRDDLKAVMAELVEIRRLLKAE